MWASGPHLTISNSMSIKQPLVCQLGMAGVNFKHNRVDLCYRSIKGTSKKYNTISEAVNDEELCKQRLQLLNGEWPAGCYDCQYMEQHGSKSYRQRVKLLDIDTPDQYFLDNVDPVTGKVKTLRRIEFRFDNTCNFACRHCSAEYSSSWEKIVRNNPQVSKFEGTDLKRFEPTSYATGLENLNEIEKFLDDEGLEIEITGGEPFFQHRFYECLEQLQPFAKRINLIVTTNGSIAGKFKKYDIKSLLAPFREVYLKVSMDGSKSFFNYFRQGGDWDTTVSNVKSFASLPNIRISPIVTISIFQAARMPEIYTDFHEINKNTNSFSAGEVLHPPMLNPIHLPKPLKQKYLKEWEEFSNGLSRSKPAKRLAEFSLKMLQSEVEDSKWIEFCQYTDQLDKIHNKNVFDYFPEWQEFWHKTT